MKARHSKTITVAIGPSSFAEEDKTPISMLEDAGLTIIPNPYGRRLNEAETISLLQNADGLIAGLEPLNRTVLSSAPRLKALARVGIGMENVDQQAAKELQIKVSNTPEGPTDAVAEMTLAAMLALSRNLIASDKALHNGEWKKAISSGLSGSNVLLIGFGRIGRRVAELIAPFRARIMVFDPMLDPQSLPAGANSVSLQQGLADADVISLHAAGATAIIGPDEFGMMKRKPILLNSARGSLVAEPALIKALDSGTIQSAWFDAFWQEPYNGPLTKYPQVLLTAHTSTYTRRCRSEMETTAVQNLLRAMSIRL
jgi:D-3-phosphoglycerate dehydrogenase / 2-oxoglutarate reductase